jgi:hypothetical protein
MTGRPKPLWWCSRKGVLCPYANSDGFCELTACKMIDTDGVLATFAVGDDEMTQRIKRLEDKVYLLEQEIERLKGFVYYI